MPIRWIVVAVALTGVGCGDGGSSPTAPTPPPTAPAAPPPGPGGGGNQSCRQVPSAYSAVTEGGGTMTGSCVFDASNVRVTCTEAYVETNGARATYLSVTDWPSRGAIVDESRVVPPLRRATRTRVTQTDGPFDTTMTYTYDGQGRLAQELETSATGPATTTYTAWDAAGRPTAATRTIPSGTLAIAYAHDDGARSTRITITPGPAPCTTFYNDQGFAVRMDCPTTGTVRTTIQSTFSVCR